jgi:hypothetical protein
MVEFEVTIGYLAWVVPSCISLVLSFFVFLNIVTSPSLRSRVFQQLVAVLAATDFIKSGCFLFGNKYYAPPDLCYFQEYMFQTGALAQALTTIMICAVAFITVYQSKVPSPKLIFASGGVLLLVLATSMGFSIYFKTARLFCNRDNSIYVGHGDSIIIAYTVSFVSLLYICVLLDICCFAVVQHKLRQMKAISDSSKDSAMLLAFVQRLQMYPLIFVSGYLLNTISMILSLAANEYDFILGVLSAFAISCTGIFISVNYFRHQQTLSVTCAKILSRIMIIRYKTDEAEHLLSAAYLFNETDYYGKDSAMPHSGTTNPSHRSALSNDSEDTFNTSLTMGLTADGSSISGVISRHSRMMSTE